MCKYWGLGKYLQFLLFAYNTSKQSSTGLSSFQLMYGWESPNISYLPPLPGYEQTSYERSLRRKLLKLGNTWKGNYYGSAISSRYCDISLLCYWTQIWQVFLGNLIETLSNATLIFPFPNFCTHTFAIISLAVIILAFIMAQKKYIWKLSSQPIWRLGHYKKIPLPTSSRICWNITWWSSYIFHGNRQDPTFWREKRVVRRWSLCWEPAFKRHSQFCTWDLCNTWRRPSYCICRYSNCDRGVNGNH